MSDPPRVTADIDPDWFLALFGGLALVVLVFALLRALRTRDVVPVAVFLGALVCALNSPIYDNLGMIVYADGALRAFFTFGRDIPLFLVLGYVPWVGGLSYVVAQLMAGGWGRARLHWIAFASFASVVVIETAGTSIGASRKMYGEAPLKYLGVAPMMAPVPIVCGALIHPLDRALQGRRGRWSG